MVIALNLRFSCSAHATLHLKAVQKCIILWRVQLLSLVQLCLTFSIFFDLYLRWIFFPGQSGYISSSIRTFLKCIQLTWFFKLGFYIKNFLTILSKYMDLKAKQPHPPVSAVVCSWVVGGEVTERWRPSLFVFPHCFSHHNKQVISSSTYNFSFLFGILEKNVAMEN